MDQTTLMSGKMLDAEFEQAPTLSLLVLKWGPGSSEMDPGSKTGGYARVLLL
jgi:hypothetical protein